ncbi:uncharacterized protein LOC134096210 [Sardina pilchardus]|uniref:uncharacterized protein LOC134096210 n=1 Tax=Sardina pilchardus TaxID=27697 RepID=UPI002E136567
MIRLMVQFTLYLVDVNPAFIYGKDQALEGEDVKFKCTLFDMQKNKAYSTMYLCKNGIGIQIEEFHVNREEVVFKLPHVNVSDTGHYSCVYSTTKHKPELVRSTDKNVTYITLVVISKPRPTSMLEEARPTPMLEEALQADNSMLFLLLLFLPLGTLIVMIWHYWYRLKIWFCRRYRKQTRVVQFNRASRITSPSISARTPPPNSPISNYEEECYNRIIYDNAREEQAPEESTNANEESDGLSHTPTSQHVSPGKATQTVVSLPQHISFQRILFESVDCTKGSQAS